MSFPRDAYPYTNFHELNLGYFIVHFREIFSQWADLYDQMLNWKEATDEELAAWKTGVEADLDQREAALRAELETWKAQTGQDIAGWEDATLAALTAWQTATQAVFEAIRVEAAGSASAASASAGDAATAKTAAVTAQAAAEAAAASVQASAAQITTNTEDIADLKTQLEVESTWVPKEITRTGGGFSGNNVGDILELTTGTTWQRTSFTPTPNTRYRITFSTRNITVPTNYIIGTKLNDNEENEIVIIYGVISANYGEHDVTEILNFSEEVETVWVKTKYQQTLTVEEEEISNVIDNLKNRITELEEGEEETNHTIEELESNIQNNNNLILQARTYYDAAIPDGIDLSTTNYADIYAAYDALCNEYPAYIERLADIGADSSGALIRAYYLHKNKNIVGTNASWTAAGGDHNNQYLNYCDIKTVLLTSGVHGDEKSGVWGLLGFVRDYISSDDLWATKLSNNEEYYIIPIINPWGYNNNSRENYLGENINREYTTSTTCVEALAVINFIYNIVNTINKTIYEVVDAHATGGNYGYIATRSTNPDIRDIMKAATDVIGECSTRWAEIVDIVGISEEYYPYAYGCLSTNNGTLPQYCIANNITNIATTVEVIKTTGVKLSQISKMSSDMIGNLLIKFLQ